MDVNIRAKIDETTNEVYINANDMLLFWVQVGNDLKDGEPKKTVKSFTEWINKYKNSAQRE